MDPKIWSPDFQCMNVISGTVNDTSPNGTLPKTETFATSHLNGISSRNQCIYFHFQTNNDESMSCKLLQSFKLQYVNEFCQLKLILSHLLHYNFHLTSIKLRSFYSVKTTKTVVLILYDPKTYSHNKGFHCCQNSKSVLYCINLL